MKREQDFERNNNPGLSKMFGKLADEYEIYKANAPAPHKSFDEWLPSYGDSLYRRENSE